MQDASALFQIVKASPVPLSLLCLSLADDGPGLAIQARINPVLFFPEQRFYRALNMRRRLDSRCKGLLEVSPVWIKGAQLSTNDMSDSHGMEEVPDRGPGPGIPIITITPPTTVENHGRDLDTGNDDVNILRDLSHLSPERADLLADARIGYLHRTVKDFLDQPAIWVKITAATGPKFNPQLALARSYLLQLKWVHSSYSNSAVPKEVWTAVFSVLNFSKQMQAMEAAESMELLNELGRVIAPLFSPSPSAPGLANSHTPNRLLAFGRNVRS
ncbi:hypothetical protein V8F33_006116 [Rhypophila sp. PSN 637]